MSLSCFLQVTDFSNFYLEKQTKNTETSVFGPQRLPAFTNTCTSSTWHYFYFLFIYFHFFFFKGGGGLKITLLSNSISISLHKTDKNISIKPKSNCSRRNHKQNTALVRYSQQLHHAKFVHHSFFKWPLWSNNFSRQNAS